MIERAEEAHRITVRHVDHDLYLALMGRALAEKRHMHEVVRDIFRREFAPDRLPFFLEGAPPMLQRTIHAYALSQGRSVQDQVIIDLADVYGIEESEL